jgi:hypothetical protein
MAASRQWVVALTGYTCVPYSAGVGDLPEYVFTIQSAGQMVERAQVVACDNDHAALGYACSMVHKLRTVGGYNDPNLMVRVFDDRRPLVFCLPFLPARA